MPDSTPARKRSRYQDLADWLTAQPGSLVTLTFTEVEAIVGARLPATARLERGWWTSLDDRHQYVQRWRARGWEVRTFDRRRRTVTFTRAPGEAAPSADKESRGPER
jgi:hypothetical protein